MNDVQTQSLFPTARARAFARQGYYPIEPTARGHFRFRRLSRSIPIQSQDSASGESWLGFGKNIDRILDKMVLLNVRTGRMVTAFQVDEKKLRNISTAFCDEVSIQRSIETEVDQLLKRIKKERVSENRFRRMEIWRKNHRQSIKRFDDLFERHRNFINEIRILHGGASHYLHGREIGLNRTNQKYLTNLLDALSSANGCKMKDSGGKRSGSGKKPDKEKAERRKALIRISAEVSTKLNALGANVSDGDLEHAFQRRDQLRLAKDFIRNLPPETRITKLAVYRFADRQAYFRR